MAKNKKSLIGNRKEPLLIFITRTINEQNQQMCFYTSLI
jgi:hypothetical protein